jgi:hypothetical protein
VRVIVLTGSIGNYIWAISWALSPAWPLLFGGAAGPYQADAAGRLHCKAGPRSPTFGLENSNRTPEPNGSCKHHFLRVDPQLRPMLSDGSFGPPQLLKARNAVASIFGLTGATYEPESRRK